jgi:hypothetical protein
MQFQLSGMRRSRIAFFVFLVMFWNIGALHHIFSVIKLQKGDDEYVWKALEDSNTKCRSNETFYGFSPSERLDALDRNGLIAEVNVGLNVIGISNTEEVLYVKSRWSEYVIVEFVTASLWIWMALYYALNRTLMNVRWCRLIFIFGGFVILLLMFFSPKVFKENFFIAHKHTNHALKLLNHKIPISRKDVLWKDSEGMPVLIREYRENSEYTAVVCADGSAVHHYFVTAKPMRYLFSYAGITLVTIILGMLIGLRSSAQMPRN